jgi:heat shock protein HspQ
MKQFAIGTLVGHMYFQGILGMVVAIEDDYSIVEWYPTKEDKMFPDNGGYTTNTIYLIKNP